VRGFVPVGGHYVASLDRIERRILASAVADTAELLGVRLPAPAAPEPGPADPLGEVTWTAAASMVPSDPALARLLPPASRDDDELAAEFRRLTEGDLRHGKVENLRIVWSGLRGPAGSLLVPRAAAPRWAAALSDVRLVLATRLDIETDEDAEAVHDLAMRDDDPPSGSRRDRTETTEAEELREAMATLYVALTWLQESLVSAMLEDTGEQGA
jgi:hypothetical protein